MAIPVTVIATGVISRIALFLVRFLWKIRLRGLALRLLAWVYKRAIYHMAKIAKLTSTETIGLLRNTIIHFLQLKKIPYRVFIKSAPRQILDLFKFHRLKPNIYRPSRATLRKITEFEAKRRIGLIKTTSIFGVPSQIIRHPWFYIFTIPNTLDWFIWPIIFSGGMYSLFHY